MEAFLPMMMFVVGVIAAGLGSYILGGVWMLVTVLGAVFAVTGLVLFSHAHLSHLIN
jgi:hypothetical protein